MFMKTFSAVLFKLNKTVARNSAICRKSIEEKRHKYMRRNIIFMQADEFVYKVILSFNFFYEKLIFKRFEIVYTHIRLYRQIK